MKYLFQNQTLRDYLSKSYQNPATYMYFLLQFQKQKRY